MLAPEIYHEWLLSVSIIYIARVTNILNLVIQIDISIIYNLSPK